MIFITAGAVNAQQNYAVIIGGDPLATNVPTANRWNQGLNMGTYGYDEFWNDAYLNWEMLYTKEGYTNENIHILFSNGNDYSFSQQSNRYNAFITYGFHITDNSATRQNVQNLLTSLQNTITPNDFLYVWIMSHGGNTNSDNSGNSYFYLNNGQIMYDYELAALVNPIQANRKVFIINVPKSGGFINDLQAANTLIYTSGTVAQPALRADNSPVEENEVINNVVYHP